MRTALPLALVGLAVTAAAGLALLPRPGAAEVPIQRPPPATASTARYRLEVVQTILEKEGDAAPLRLAELGGAGAAAVAPVSSPAAAAGYFGAVRNPPGILGAIRARWPGARILFTGQAEGAFGDRVTLTGDRRFPVTSRDLRGGQLIVTTRFEKVGVRLELTGGEHDLHELAFEVSAVSAWGRSGAPVITEVSSKGRILLPDGSTAVFSFTDRVGGEELGEGAAPARSGEKAKPARDVLVRTFVLLTRLDLTRR